MRCMKGNGQFWLEVAETKKVLNDEVHRELLFNRCILEYRFLDQDDELQCWYDVHPLIRGILEFQSALDKVEGKKLKRS